MYGLNWIRTPLMSTMIYIYVRFISRLDTRQFAKNMMIFLKACRELYKLTVIKAKNILICDFNARTGTLNDFTELEETSDSDNNLLPPDYTEDIILPVRNNTDKFVNDQGQTLIELCIESRLRLLNGRLMGDSLGYRTY